jgi:hypothetical protein
MKPSLMRSPVSFSRISSEEDDLEDGIMINEETDTQIEIGENSVNPMGSSAFEIEDVEAQEEERESDPNNGVISPPFNYVCPLTLRLMEAPVYDLCGHAFERAAISDWLEYHNMCPISRRPMEIADLVPSPILQSRIQQWEEEHQEAICHLNACYFHKNDPSWKSSKSVPVVEESYRNVEDFG